MSEPDDNMAPAPGGDQEPDQQVAGGQTQPGNNIESSVPGLSPFHQTARYYASLRLSIFALAPTTKIPTAGSHGYKDATSDLAKVDAWWSEHPGYNIGWCPGADGYVVIDCDRHHEDQDGPLEFEQWWAAYTAGGAIAPTLTMLTARGGVQYIYELPPGVAVPTRTGWLPGVDVKSAKGHVLLPPSIRGGQDEVYRWVNADGWFDKAAVALCPDVLLKAIRSSGKVSRLGATGGVGQIAGTAGPQEGAAISEGNRNTTLFQLGCRFRRQLRDDRIATESALRGVNAVHCRPPLSETEVAKVLESVWAQDHSDVAQISADLDVAESAAAGWEPPVALISNADLPEFPAHALAPALGDMVTALAESTQVPVDLPAVIALSAFNASLVGRVRLRIRDDWTEQSALYVLGLIESGNRKSSTVKALTAPLYKVQEQLREQMRPIVRDAEAKLKVLKAVEVAAKGMLRKDPDDPDAQERIRQAALAVALAEETMPRLPTLVIDDATPESLAQTMAHNRDRLAVFDAEGGGLITLTGSRYSDNPYIDLLLKAHAGDAVSSSRVSRGALSMESPSLTIGVLSQPETLKELRGVSSAEGRGLLARFLISSPREILGRRKIEPDPMPKGTADTYARLVSSMAHTLWNGDPKQFEPGKHAEIGMDEAAQRRLIDYARAVEGKLTEDGELRSLGGFAGKLVGAAGRYALLHHLSWYGAAGLDYPVTVGSVERGILIADYSVEHYRYAMRVAGISDHTKLAERALGWITRNDKRDFSRREVQKGLGTPTMDEVEPAVALLVKHGYCRAVNVASGGRAGRPGSPRYEVNPLLSNLSNRSGGGS